MRRGRKSRHVQPDLGDQDVGDAATYTWDGLQTVQGVLNRAEPLLHFGVELFDELVQAVEMSELTGE